MTNTQSVSYIAVLATHTNSYTVGTNFFAIVYEYDILSTPSFSNKFFKCTPVNSTVSNWCVALGYPVNWIVEYHYTGTFPSSITSKIDISNGLYSGTFSALTRCFSSTSLTVFKSYFNLIYTPNPILTVSFSKNANVLYKGA